MRIGEKTKLFDGRVNAFDGARMHTHPPVHDTINRCETDTGFSGDVFERHFNHEKFPPTKTLDQENEVCNSF